MTLFSSSGDSEFFYRCTIIVSINFFFQLESSSKLGNSRVSIFLVVDLVVFKLFFLLIFLEGDDFSSPILSFSFFGLSTLNFNDFERLLLLLGLCFSALKVGSGTPFLSFFSCNTLLDFILLSASIFLHFLKISYWLFLYVDRSLLCFVE